MISLVLFSFAIAGVLAIAVSMAQGYREQRQIVVTESSARGAIDFIADALRMASPAVSMGEVETPPSTATQIHVGAIEDTTGAVGACPVHAITATNNTGLNGSDILEVVFASGPAVTSVANSPNFQSDTTSLAVNDITDFAVGDRVLVSNGGNGHVYKVNAITPGTGDAGTFTLDAATCTPISPPTQYLPASLVVRVMRARFYLAAHDGVATVMMMDPDSDGPMVAEPLADWVEDFQVALGIDEVVDGTIAADEWAFSAAHTPAVPTDARLLRAIRITLVVRAESNLSPANPTYQRPAVEDHAAGGMDRYRRRVLTSTVDIRNLSGSPQ
jgi:hypothetical protein